MFSVLSILMSLHKKFDEFKGNIFSSWWISIVQILNSMLSVTVVALVRFFCKPWRVVELTTCAGGSTVLTIPEKITGVESKQITGYPGRVNATLTKNCLQQTQGHDCNYVCHKGIFRQNSSCSPLLCQSSGKCPNMLSAASASMSQTYTINIASCY